MFAAKSAGLNRRQVPVFEVQKFQYERASRASLTKSTRIAVPPESAGMKKRFRGAVSRCHLGDRLEKS
jgi:hypothetical protein